MPYPLVEQTPPTALPEWLNANVKSAEKHSLHILARQENTVPKPAMANHVAGERAEHIFVISINVRHIFAQ